MAVLREYHENVGELIFKYEEARWSGSSETAS